MARPRRSPRAAIPAAPAAWVLLSILQLQAAEARAAQPIDRLQKLLDARRFEEVAEDATRWLARNGGHEDEAAVSAILAEADWMLLLARPSVDGAKLYRVKWPGGRRATDVLTLEASLVLYSIDAAPSEQRYLDLVDRYGGTPAAAEALVRAEGIAWQDLGTTAEAGAIGAFLARYPAGPHHAAGLARWRELAWSEAERTGSVEAWVRLRAEDPEHPRVAEAAAREQQAALSALQPTSPSADWLKVARRYDGTDAGWAALEGALARAMLRAESADGTTIDRRWDERGEIMLTSGLRSVVLDLGGGAPKGVTIQLDHTWSATDGSQQPWSEVAAGRARAWGLPPLETGGTADGGFRWSTPLPTCAEQRGEGGEIRLLVRGTEGRQIAAGWPVTTSRGCGGPSPLVLVREPGARVVAWEGPGVADQAGGGPRERPLRVDPLGMSWVCDGPGRRDSRGLWLACSGWEILPGRGGFAIRAPSPEPAPLAAPSPTPPTAEGSRERLAVPPDHHFGAAPACAHPQPVPVAPVPDLVRAAPPRPAWIAAGFQALSEAEADLDADGLPDLVLVLAGRADDRAWAVVQPGAPGSAGWAVPVDAAHVPGRPPVRWDGCQFVAAPELP